MAVFPFYIVSKNDLKYRSSPGTIYGKIGDLNVAGSLFYLYLDLEFHASSSTHPDGWLFKTDLDSAICWDDSNEIITTQMTQDDYLFLDLVDKALTVS